MLVRKAFFSQAEEDRSLPGPKNWSRFPKIPVKEEGAGETGQGGQAGGLGRTSNQPLLVGELLEPK